jgi:hypothetical protein
MYTQYTDLELEVLNILAREADFGDGEWAGDKDSGLAEFDAWLITYDGLNQGDDVTIFQEYDLDPAIYRGVIGSLVKKGYVAVDEVETINYKDSSSGRYVSIISIAITQETFNEIYIPAVSSL